MIDLWWYTQQGGQLVLHASPSGGHPWVGVTRYPWDAESQWALLWSMIRAVIEVWEAPEPKWLELDGKWCQWTPQAP